jgi:hypothetical protein
MIIIALHQQIKMNRKFIYPFACGVKKIALAITRDIDANLISPTPLLPKSLSIIHNKSLAFFKIIIFIQLNIQKYFLS